MRNISFRYFNAEVTADGILITILTDVPSTIFIRWTQLPPWIHKKPSMRRGVQFAEDVRFCFDVYTDLEQDQVGDTTTHTFKLPYWMLDSDYWLYPWGKIDDQVSPSSGPIFHIHTPACWPPPPEPVRYAWCRVFSSTGTVRWTYPGYKFAPTFFVTPTPTKSVTFLLFSQNNDATTVRISLSLVDVDNKPLDSLLTWTDITLSDGVFDDRCAPAYPVYIQTISLPYDYLPGTNYALVQETLTGLSKFWARFRIYGWQGARDQGEENHITTHATHAAYPDWTPVSPYKQCYEAWGMQ